MTASFNASYAEEAVGKCMVPLIIHDGQCVLAHLQEGRAWVRHGKKVTMLTTEGPLLFHGPFRGKLFCKPGSRVLWYEANGVRRERDK